jgi:hypothetical protein
MENLLADSVGQKCAGENPDQAKQDHQAAEESAKQQKGSQAVVANPREHVRQLQADQDEDQVHSE